MLVAIVIVPTNTTTTTTAASTLVVTATATAAASGGATAITVAVVGVKRSSMVDAGAWRQLAGGSLRERYPYDTFDSNTAR